MIDAKMPDNLPQWMKDHVERYLKSGGTLKELKKRFADACLKVADLIGFAEWIVESTSQSSSFPGVPASSPSRPSTPLRPTASLRTAASNSKP